jgi:hypothetical protein
MVYDFHSPVVKSIGEVKMAKRRTPMTKERIAAAIEAVADRVAQEDYSFDIQVTASKAELGLTELRNVEALKLLSRVSILLLTKNGTKTSPYKYVQKQLESLTPLDSVADSAALRAVAQELRVSK